MDKKDFVDLLQKKGFNASLDSNVPMISLLPGQTPEQIRELASKASYTGSFGYLIAAKGSKVAKMAPVSEQLLNAEDAPDSAFMVSLDGDDMFGDDFGGGSFGGESDDGGFAESGDGQLSFF